MAKAKILVVEDEAIIAWNILATLKKLNYDTTVAYSGKEAIEKAEEIKPDLILMGIVLKKDMDGIETAGQIRDRFNIPVVYFTAYINEKRIEKILETNPYGFIIKPYKTNALHLTIEIALQRWKTEQELRKRITNYRLLLSPTTGKSLKH